MSLKLHVFPPSPRAFKVLSVANHLGLDYELCLVDFSKGTHKTPQYTALNPNQRMPTLEEDGFVLWESSAIMHYLAAKRPESGLLPADPKKYALVNQWQFWEASHWGPACATLMFENCVKALFGLGAPNPEKVAEGEQSFRRVAAVLDGHLKNKSFVVGDAPTVADFSIGSVLHVQEARIPVQDYPNIVRWHQALMNLPGWRASMVPVPAKAA